MSGILNDVQVSLRQLRKTPGFSAAAILVLALSIGLNAAMFGLSWSMIFEKLPEDVPGYGRLETRRADFKQVLASLGNSAKVNADNPAAVGPHVRREPLSYPRLSFIRRLHGIGSRAYFVTK